MDQDRKFFDTFMLILCAMIGLTVAIYFIANALADNTVNGQHLESKVAQERIDQRLAGPATVRVAGEASPAPAPAAAPAAPAPVDGKAIYESTCYACHGLGVAGAPKFGDAAAWAPHLAKGMAVLKDHALHGFTGENGIMPAKGGRADLSDEQVLAALDYMLEHSK